MATLENHANHEKRLLKAYENTQNSLNIATRVAMANMRTPATMYHMEISFQSTRNKWTIAKRYSEFYAVRRQLKKLLKQSRHHLHLHDQHGEASLPLKALENVLEASFPRRHLRFDTPSIVEERRPALEAFVQLLVKVISCIPLATTTSASASSPGSSASGSPTMMDSPIAVAAALENVPPVLQAQQDFYATLYKILRDFLEYPDKQIESETKLKLAVLTLEDVVVSSKRSIFELAPKSDCCSICLAEWDDEECVGMNVVKLPCSHAFHEECLMEWLNGSVQCPMCRTDPVDSVAAIATPASTATSTATTSSSPSSSSTASSAATGSDSPPRFF